MSVNPTVESLRDDLEGALGPGRVEPDRVLAPLTTFKVGGPADLYVEPRSAADVLTCLRLASARQTPVTLLGGGSNVLVADAGVRGLVLRPRGGRIERLDERHVRADAAVTINGLVRWLIGHGLSGLEAWAGTPGTVGGGIYGNAHWAGRLLSESVSSVLLASPAGEVRQVPAGDMEFGYDRSRLQRTGEVLLSADLLVAPGDPERLRETARASLAYRKKTQPLATPSAGCIFQNPARTVRLPPGVPASAGALIDRAGLKGARQGGAEVSTRHANFIVNTKAATAHDIRTLVERCRTAVADKFGVRLDEEIVYLGDFPPGAGGARVDSVD